MRFRAITIMSIAFSLGGLIPVVAVAKTTTVPISATYGKVSSMGTGMLNIVVGKRTYTVTVSSKTVYQNAKAKKRTMSEIKKGNNLWVWGQKNTTKRTISGVTKIKDMSVSK